MTAVLCVGSEMRDLEISGPTDRAGATDGELAAAELRFGVAIPPSLKSFLKEYGYGRFGGLILFYAPDATHCDGLEARYEAMREELELALSEDIGELEPDGSAELYQRAVPFARSENGGFFVYDAAGQADEREIYFIAPRMVGCFRAASSIDELLRRLTSVDVARILGPGYRPLPATFEPLRRL